MIDKRPDHQLKCARAMRRAMRKAEEILWNSVRDSALGVRVRRQVPIGPYIADFACLTAKLVIELDGPPHERAEQQEHDRCRDAWMRERGWRVLRLSNDVVFEGGGMVLETIMKAMKRDPSSDLASRGHLLPPAGEGQGEARDESSTCP